MVNIEIVVIGNEVLLGAVQDTNSNYLCRMVRGMGGRVRHIATVRDEAEAIADEIKRSLARRADLIFTCGGLGPTDDDLTLGAIAASLGLKLSLDEAAHRFVEWRYKELADQGYVEKAGLTDARLKMARLPEGAEAIENPVGAAPAAMLKVSGCRIISLPGVPSELKAIIEGPLQKTMREIFGRGSYREREVTVKCGDESALAPALRRVATAHPDVYIKSRASHFGRDITFRVLLSASAKRPEEADQMIERAFEDLTRALQDAGIQKPEAEKNKPADR